MVAVACRTARARRWERYVAARAHAALTALALTGSELSVALVDDREMRLLNRTYRRRDRATDVLAFALTEELAAASPAAGSPRGHRRMLGDVVISIDTAAAQARADRCALATRLDALLGHGLLHLIGYDHERSPVEERRMLRKEREVRAALPSRAATTVPREAPPALRSRMQGERRARRR